MVLEVPNDPVTWSKRTQYQFMSGEWLLVAPVYEDTIVRNDIYLPAGKWIDYWDGREYNGPTTLNAYDAPLDKLPMFVKAGAIIPMYPEMLHDREKPKDPMTLDLYPFGKTSFSLYEDDGLTREYQAAGFARTLIEVDAPKSLDEPGTQVTVKVGAAKGTYKGMPASRSYVVDIHLPVKPASVRIGERVVQAFEVPPAGRGGDRAARDKARAAFDAAPEGWLYDAPTRAGVGGVLHVRVKAQPLTTGFLVRVGL
jgi:hypothetical protein